MTNVRKRIFNIIQIGNRGDLPSRLFDYFIVLVIAINIAVLFMETFDVFTPYLGTLKIIESATIAIFIIEYILRLWTADLLYPQYKQPKAALRFIISFDGIVDLFTILPFFFLSGFVAFRILRVVRIFRLFKVNASYDSFHVIATVFKKKKNQIFSSVFIILMLMMVSSLCIYSAEHDAQPEAFKNAFSGIWWSLSTIFTVGYGDIYPITLLGQIMTIIITFLGVGAVAIPTGIISAGFVEQYTELAKATQAAHDNLAAMHKATADTLQADQAAGTLIEVVTEGSPYAGLTVEHIAASYGRSVLAISRDGNVVAPGPQTKINVGDTLISRC